MESNTEFVEPRLIVDYQIQQTHENNRNQQDINLTQVVPGQQDHGLLTTAVETGFVRQSRQISELTSSNTAPCRAYEAAELYRRRKEFKLKRIQQEEEKLRCVKAKPMPNFKAIHSKALTTVKESPEGCVSPVTLQVLRRGLAMKKKHNQKLSERLPIVARSTRVLNEVPFRPKLEPRQLKVEPFNLKMDERLTQRKQWDENYQRKVAMKKEKEQEQKEIEEARTRQVIREKTTFQARPNPFKKEKRNENLD